jgi:hypothetical protein
MSWIAKAVMGVSLAFLGFAIHAPWLYTVAGDLPDVDSSTVGVMSAFIFVMLTALVGSLTLPLLSRMTVRARIVLLGCLIAVPMHALAMVSYPAFRPSPLGYAILYVASTLAAAITFMSLVELPQRAKTQVGFLFGTIWLVAITLCLVTVSATSYSIGLLSGMPYPLSAVSKTPISFRKVTDYWDGLPYQEGSKDTYPIWLIYQENSSYWVEIPPSRKTTSRFVKVPKKIVTGYAKLHSVDAEALPSPNRWTDAN